MSLGFLKFCAPAVLIALFVSSPSFAKSLPSTNVPTDPNDVKRENFSFDTRLRYNSALVNGIKTLNVLIASKMGRTDEAIKSFEACGGKVGYHFDPVGYFWGSIPTADLPKLLAVEDIVDIELDGPTNSGVDYIEPTDPDKLKPGSVWLRQKALKPLSVTTAKLPLLPADKLEGDNPYLPWYLMGVPQFLKEHPTFDGRGTTIAVVEGYGDLLHPALQAARRLDGTPISKVVGILDTSDVDDPYYDRGRGYLPTALSLPMVDEVSTPTATLRYQGQAFIVPAAGTYKIALFDNGGRSFWVLWSLNKNSVWVDTNQNNSFADEAELKDIAEQFSAANFPQEYGGPDQPFASATSFAVSIDRAKSNIKLFVNQDDHATGVASIAAGVGFLGGRGTGVAPGARILYVPRGSGSLHEDIKAFIATACRQDVDVITASFVIKPMIAGETVASLILDRLAVLYQKPMFFTATAGPSSTTDNISDQATGSHVFAVMGYTPPEVWKALNGVNVPLRDNDPDGGGEGPAINGALKPDFLAPFHQIAAGNCTPNDWDQSHSDVSEGFRVPHCYVKFGGTSGSTPEVAAVAALLISASKQIKIPITLDRIAWALRSSATYLDQMPEPIGYQGYGLPNVQNAWSSMASAELTPSFVVTSQSNGPREFNRRQPHAGVGIYEYANWHPGMSGSAFVTITRKDSENSRRALFLLKWRGNDGTFMAPNSVVLAFDKPTPVPIDFKLATPGIHQAILEIVDPSTDRSLGSFLNTVVASQPVALSSTPTSWQGEVPLSHEVCPTFDVAAGTSVLSVTVTISKGPAIFWTGPSTSRGSDSYLRYFLPNQNPNTIFFKAPGTRHVLIANPADGVWAFCVRNHQGAADRQGENVASIDARIEVSPFQLALKLSDIHLRAEPDGRTQIGADLSVKNIGVGVRRPIIKSEPAIVDRRSMSFLPDKRTLTADFAIPEETSQLSLLFPRRAGNLTAFVYLCGQNSDEAKRCKLLDVKVATGPLDYIRPSPGTWKVLLSNDSSSDTRLVDKTAITIVRSAFANSSALDLNRGSLTTTPPILTDESVQTSLSVTTASPSAQTEALITTVFDGAEEDEETPSRKDFRHFFTNTSRPAAVGRSIDLLPKSVLNSASLVKRSPQ